WQIPHLLGRYTPEDSGLLDIPFANRSEPAARRWRRPQRSDLRASKRSADLQLRCHRQRLVRRRLTCRRVYLPCSPPARSPAWLPQRTRSVPPPPQTPPRLRPLSDETSEKQPYRHHQMHQKTKRGRHLP